METSADSPSPTAPPVAPPPVVTARGVTQRFGGQEVLHGVDLDVPRGAIMGLLGPSGAGKTTLVNILAGVSKAVSGEVCTFGERMPSLKLMARMGFMAQSDALYPDLTGWENLEFFGSLYGVRGRALREGAERATKLARLDVEPGKLVRQYSGGMRRRLSLAAALLHDPELAILDEPTVGLDPVNRIDIWEAFHRLTAEGHTLIVTTHVMDEAERCDTLAMVRDGSFIAKGTPDELKERAGTADLEGAFLYFARGTGSGAGGA